MRFDNGTKHFFLALCVDNSLQQDCFDKESFQDYELHEDGVRCKAER